MSRKHSRVLEAALGPEPLASLVAIVAGGIFVIFGLGKFVNHGGELASFRSYGLPWPELTVIAIGLLETVGGALLIARRFVGPVALLLAGNMVAAIAVSGIGRGEVVPSLTLAPVLLVAMLYLVSRHRAAIGLARWRPSRRGAAPQRPGS